MIKYVLNNCLKNYRTKYKVTQEDIADKLNIKRSYYSEIERNIYTPSTYLAFQICKAMNDIIFEKQKLKANIRVDDLFYLEKKHDNVQNE